MSRANPKKLDFIAIITLLITVSFVACLPVEPTPNSKLRMVSELVVTHTPTPTSTPTPTPTDILTPTVSPTPTPTATPTIPPPPTNTATTTPTPTITPTPSITPTSTPVPLVCAQSPRGEFVNLWQLYKNQLGCPMDTSPLYGTFAEMPFQRGHLFWIGQVGNFSDLRLVIATFGGQDEGNTGTWSLHQEDWRGEGICEVPSPPEGLYLPDRGLANVWCEIDGLNRLGYATAPREFVPNRGIAALQNFDKAVIFRDSDGHTKGLVYILYRDSQAYVRVKY